MYTSAHADGNGAMDLYLKIFEIARLPYLDYDPKNREQNALMYPKMDGKRVFLNAVRGMVMSTQAALAKTGLTWDDIQWFVPHQANLRINEKVAEVAKIPREKVLNTIEFYGNTTAATVPLTIDYWRQQGKVKKGDRILSTRVRLRLHLGRGDLHALRDRDLHEPAGQGRLGARRRGCGSWMPRPARTPRAAPGAPATAPLCDMMRA